MSLHSRGLLTAGPSKKRKEPSAPIAAEQVSSNRLLAGYMAYEFLTKGTLLGRKFDPARAEAMSSAQPEPEPARTKQHQSYSDVASILKRDGAHIYGIVNPTQLICWLQK